MSSFRFFSLVASLLFFASCGQNPSEAPRASSENTTLDLPISQLTVPITYSLQDLEKLINSKIQGTVYKDKSFTNHDNDGIKLTVEKARDIRITMKGSVAYLRIPLRIKFKFDKKISKISVRNKNWIETTLTMNLASKVSLDQNWKLITQTRFKSIEWQEEPKIKVAFVEVNLRKPLEMALSRYQEQLQEKIDEAIHKNVSISQPVEKLWNKLHKPILVKKDEPQVWLTIAGKKLEVGQVTSNGAQLTIPLRLFAQIQSMSGTPPNLAPPKLPPAIRLTDHRHDFELHVKSTIAYEHINQALNAKLGTKKIGMGDWEIKLQEMQVYGSDSQKLVVKTSISGGLSGVIYLQGKPTLVKDSMMLKLEDFEYDINSMGSIFASADWFMHDLFKSRISQELQLPLQAYLDQIPEIVHQGVEKSKAGKKIDVDLKEVEVELLGIQFNQNHIEVLAKATGKVALELQKLE